MYKLVILLLLFPISLSYLNAQEGSNRKFILELGMLPLTPDAENLELFIKAEPKLKVLNNSFIGLRLGLTLNSSTFNNNEEEQFILDEVSENALISFVPTFDYYLNPFQLHEKQARSYVGVGIGYYLLSSMDVEHRQTTTTVSQTLEVNFNRRLGLLLRAGLESNNLRIGIEYTHLAKADIQVLDGQNIGQVMNNYLGLSIGFVL